MAEGSWEATGKSRKMAVGTNFLLEIDRFPRDLLRGFVSVSDDNSGRNSRYETIRVDDCTSGDGDGDDEIELNLGLSLGGRFGVDKTPGKLKRSSSVAGTMPILGEQDEQECATAARPSNLTYYTVGLTRTTSLPAETEEEWRKRKEIQTLRRMEAKKRRIGKQKTCSDAKDGFFQSQSSVDSDGLDGGINGGGAGGRGSCSSLSELDSRNQQGSSNSCGEECSPGFITHCSPCHETEKPCVSVTKPSETEKPAMRKCNSIDGRGKEGAATLNMPCVFTKGGGPNGRKIEGILYRYGKGEEVRIMCVCHGSFLSPAEFVRHAGGGDVDHPLRHIVVNTSSSISSLFL